MIHFVEARKIHLSGMDCVGVSRRCQLTEDKEKVGNILQEVLVLVSVLHRRSYLTDRELDTG